MEEWEDGKKECKRNDKGTPQGGVISPLLANIYLNVLDTLWVVKEVQERLAARLGYADGSGDKSSIGWIYESINLNSFAGQTGLYIRFRFDSDMSVNSEGVFLDEISLTGNRLPAAVPESSTMLLLGSGLIGLFGLKRKLRK